MVLIDVLTENHRLVRLPIHRLLQGLRHLGREDVLSGIWIDLEKWNAERNTVFQVTRLAWHENKRKRKWGKAAPTLYQLKLVGREEDASVVVAVCATICR